MAGDYVLAIGAKVLAQIRHEEVLSVLAQVLADLVRGEFQQLQNKDDASERFQLYLAKTFNKTASLIAYSCKANALLASDHLKDEAIKRSNSEAAYSYGRSVGIAFQLVDDLLDFEASSEQLGKKSNQTYGNSSFVPLPPFFLTQSKNTVRVTSFQANSIKGKGRSGSMEIQTTYRIDTIYMSP